MLSWEIQYAALIKVRLATSNTVVNNTNRAASSFLPNR